jgi:hypothetical protein
VDQLVRDPDRRQQDQGQIGRSQQAEPDQLREPHVAEHTAHEGDTHARQGDAHPQGQGPDPQTGSHLARNLGETGRALQPHDADRGGAQLEEEEQPAHQLEGPQEIADPVHQVQGREPIQQGPQAERHDGAHDDDERGQQEHGDETHEAARRANVQEQAGGESEYQGRCQRMAQEAAGRVLLLAGRRSLLDRQLVDARARALRTPEEQEREHQLQHQRARVAVHVPDDLGGWLDGRLAQEIEPSGQLLLELGPPQGE